MKIGIISDIHAELDGLKLALDQLHGVDQIICAGDLIDKGHEPNQVVELIRARGIPCVRGNHDDLAPDNQRWLREILTPERQKERLLTEDNLKYLANLPLKMSFQWAGTEVLLAHATPWNIHQYVFPFSTSDMFNRVAKAADANIVILGHTHEPMRVYARDVMILNPGSICGLCSQGSRSYGILTLPEQHFQVYSVKTGKPIAI